MNFEINNKQKIAKSRLVKFLLVLLGFIFLLLATLGIFIPLLPTTPLLLLSAACFIRSSRRLYNWLIHHRLFGFYIRNYLERKAIPLRAKMVTLILLWITIGYASWAVVNAVYLRVLLLSVGVGVTWHIYKLPTLSGDQRLQKPDQQE